MFVICFYVYVVIYWGVYMLCDLLCLLLFLLLSYCRIVVRASGLYLGRQVVVAEVVVVVDMVVE